MADMDVEAMLDAPLKGLQDTVESGSVGDSSPEAAEKAMDADTEDDTKAMNERRGDRDRSRGRDTERVKERDRNSYRERDRDRDRERERDKDKDKGRDRGRDRYRDRDRGHDRYRDRDRRDRDRDRERERERERRRRSRSRTRERTSLRRRPRSKSRSEERAGGRGRGGSTSPRPRKSRSPRPALDRKRSRSRDRKEREPPPMTEAEQKAKAYIEALDPEERKRLDDPLEKETRSVVCMQLSVKLRNRDLAEYFEAADVLVRDVRIISDRNSRRSKGIAYVELLRREDMTKAIGLTGTKLMGVPIIVQYSQAEKNRLAQQQQAATLGPTKLYVGGLQLQLSESDVKEIFQVFGEISSVALQKDDQGSSKGFAFVNFKKSEHAKVALEQMNGMDVAGRQLKVGWETSGKADVLSLDDEEGTGVSLSAVSRHELMSKLAASKDLHSPALTMTSLPMTNPLLMAGRMPGAGLLPTGGLVGGTTANVAQATQYLILKNMFDPKAAKEEEWDQDLKEDVEEECKNYGNLLHAAVDTASPQGAVYVKFDAVGAATKALRAMTGRWFDGRVIAADYVTAAQYAAKYPGL